MVNDDNKDIRSTNEALLLQFGTRQYRNLSTILLVAFIIFIVGIAWLALSKNRQTLLFNVQSSLETMLESTVEGLDIWVQNKRLILERVGQDEELARLTEQLLQLDAKREVLINSPLQREIRAYFSHEKHLIGDIGFFIISPDYISISSKRDSNIGSINLIAEQRPALLKRVFLGETVFIPPIHSDVEIAESDQLGKPPTMFIAAPIKNGNNEIIAIVTQRLLPEKEFSRVMQLGRIGQTGETYAFDKQGRLMSNSRFDDDLRRIGLIEPDQVGLLNIEIRNPGGNLVNGETAHKPQHQHQQPLTRMAASAVTGQSGVDMAGYQDYRGVPVFGAWLWDETLDLGFASEIDVEEALATYNIVRQTTIGVLGVTLFISIFATLLTSYLGRRANRALRQARDELEDRVRERTAELFKLNQAVEQSPIAVMITDTDGVIDYVNPAFTEDTGFLPEDAIGKKPSILKAGYTSDEEYAEIWQTIANGGTWEGEFLNKRKDKSLYWNKSIINSIHSPSNEITHYLSLMEDISSRKEMEQQLHDAKEEADNRANETKVLEELLRLSIADKSLTDYLESALNALIDNTPWLRLQPKGAIFLTEREGDSQTLKMVVNKNLADPLLTLCDKVPFGHCMCGRAAQTGAIQISQHVDERHETSFDGMADHGHINMPIMKGDTVLGVVVLYLPPAHQVTSSEREYMTQVAGVFSMGIALHYNHQALEKARGKAEEATRAKSNFLANMSHEIRTPMNAIIGMSHLTMQTELTSKQKDYVRKIFKAANSLLGIINDILDFSKIEAGQLNIESIPFHLDDVLENLTSLTTISTRSKGLEFLISIAPDLPNSLVGDPLRLGQILTNLVSNAIKFTEQGEIVVKASVLQRSASQVRLQFIVSDTGIGMTSEQQANMFQAFSQADSSTTRKFGGTGLGLSICKQLVGLMDGVISVESSHGEGSRFTFDVQLGIHEEKRPSSWTTLPNELHGMPALVIDDSSNSQEILLNLLHNLSFEVTTAASGEAGLELIDQAQAQGTPFKLVLLDWKMPGLDGIETTKRLRANPKLDPQPVVIMATAYGRDEVLRHTSNIKLDGLVLKPVTPSTLYDTLMEAFQQGEEGRSSVLPIEEWDLGLKAVENIRGARILLVEDNEINQQVAAELLEQAQLLVTIANNGQEAVKWAGKESFDCVLMDLQMSVMDGFEATHALRADQSYDSLPIIAMTANAMPEDQQRCLAAGMNDHIAKPIDPKEMFATLVRWIKPGKHEAQKALATPTTAEASDLTLPDLPGIDLQSALMRVGGSHKSYLKLLKKFATNQAKAISKTRTALQQGDQELAVRTAHTLRGVAGNIGATALQNSAAELEAGLREAQSDLQPILERTAEELRKLLDLIEPLTIDQQTAPAHKTINHDVLTSKLRQLLQQLEAYDTESDELLDEILKQPLAADLRADLQRLQQLIGQYDFDNATGALKHLIEQRK